MDAQIKLSVVASDIFGVSGRAMLAALIAGERDPKVLAQLARRRLRAKLSQLEEAFHGRFSDHHAFLLDTMLGRIDQASADIAAVEAKVEELIAPFAQAVERLDEIPGVGATAAHVMIAESGRRGALLRRAPLRTVHATRRRTRLSVCRAHCSTGMAGLMVHGVGIFVPRWRYRTVLTLEAP